MSSPLASGTVCPARAVRGPGEHGGHHLPGHRPERLVALRGVPAHPEVDLGQRRQPGQLQQVDEQPDLHAVTGHERHPLEGRPPPGVLAAQGLDEAGELRPQRVEQRPGGQLGHPAAARRTRIAGQLQRAGVAALHVDHLRIGQQRREQTGHEMGDVADQVRVEEDHEVTGRGGQRLPQRLALAGARAVRGQHLGRGDDVGPRRPGHGGGGVGGVGVHDEQLVHEGHAAHPSFPQVRDERSDRRRLVPGGEDDADPVATAALGTQQGGEIEFGQARGRRRAVPEPGARVGSHRPTVGQDGRPGQDDAALFTRSSRGVRRSDTRRPTRSITAPA